MLYRDLARRKEELTRNTCTLASSSGHPRAPSVATRRIEIFAKNSGFMQGEAITMRTQKENVSVLMWERCTISHDLLSIEK